MGYSQKAQPFGSGSRVKHVTVRGKVSGAAGARNPIGDAPEVDDLTDRFEELNELILCGCGEQSGHC